MVLFITVFVSVISQNQYVVIKSDICFSSCPHRIMILCVRVLIGT